VNRGLFLDRDGTVIEECGYLKDPTLVRFLPGAADALGALASEGWKIVIVSNQSGVGRGLITPDQMDAVQRRFLELMQSSGIPIADSYVCTHTPADHCQCRKPSPYFIERAAIDHSLDLSASWMIGDREADILAGKNAGCSTIWLRNEVFAVAHDLPTFVANDWIEIFERIALTPRRELKPFPQ
jgi:D-glycero-D-manno-heptose 1,7-bisphosphate phosphatase